MDPLLLFWCSLGKDLWGSVRLRRFLKGKPTGDRIFQAGVSVWEASFCLMVREAVRNPPISARNSPSLSAHPPTPTLFRFPCNFILGVLCSFAGKFICLRPVNVQAREREGERSGESIQSHACRISFEPGFNLGVLNTVDGCEIRSHNFETMVETNVCWYFQGNHHSRVFWVVQDFVHPQYAPERKAMCCVLWEAEVCTSECRSEQSQLPGSRLFLVVHLNPAKQGTKVFPGFAIPNLNDALSLGSCQMRHVCVCVCACVCGRVSVP